MTVSTPRRRPGRVLLRLLAIVVATTATLVLPMLAVPPLAAAAPTLAGHWTFDEGTGTRGMGQQSGHLSAAVITPSVGRGARSTSSPATSTTCAHTRAP